MLVWEMGVGSWGWSAGRGRVGGLFVLQVIAFVAATPFKIWAGVKKRKMSFSKLFTVSSPSPKGLTFFLDLQLWQKRCSLFILSRNTPHSFQENRTPLVLKVATYLTADGRVYRIAKGTECLSRNSILICEGRYLIFLYNHEDHLSLCKT